MQGGGGGSLVLEDGVVLLDHGSGGRATHKLLRELFFEAFGYEDASFKDSALLSGLGDGVAFTTDCFTVDPLFFPGGTIGSLAVHGVVNDLAVSGAEPLFMSVGFVLEEGYPLKDLTQVVSDMAGAARSCGIKVVCGDTKVVPRGKGDGIFVAASALGRLHPNARLDSRRIEPGDEIVVSGPVGEHGVAVLTAREGLPFEGLKSDSAPVWEPVSALLSELGPELKVMRDPTRGGLATTLNELAEEAEALFFVEESEVPVRGEVRKACEILGLDPLYLACEGRFVAVVKKGSAEKALEVLKGFEVSRGARVVGWVEGVGVRPLVVLRTELGGERILPVLTGEPLPRIC